jgi:hypothetical protein
MSLRSYICPICDLRGVGILACRAGIHVGIVRQPNQGPLLKAPLRPQECGRGSLKGHATKRTPGVGLQISPWCSQTVRRFCPALRLRKAGPP